MWIQSTCHLGEGGKSIEMIERSCYPTGQGWVGVALSKKKTVINMERLFLCCQSFRHDLITISITYFSK